MSVESKEFYQKYFCLLVSLSISAEDACLHEKYSKLVYKITIYIYIYIQRERERERGRDKQTDRRRETDTERWEKRNREIKILGSIPGRVILKTQNMVLDASLLTLRYASRVKWSNPGKGVTTSSIPWCGSYRKGSLRVTLHYGRQLYLHMNSIAYICVCVCVCAQPLHTKNMQHWVSF